MTRNYLGLHIFVLILVNFLSIPTQAAPVPQLYEEQIPVQGQGREERNQVLQQAFKDVLTRVSGRSDVGFLPGMDAYLKQASRYVQQFRYRLVAEPVVEPVSGQETRQILWVRFNENAVNQLLYTQNLPVWGKNRPALLVWLVVDDGKKRQLISNDSHHEVRSVIDRQAKVRGLPVRFPLLDLTDRANLRISDVWANFEDTILAASQRYQAEAILVGRVYQGFSGAWSARWSMYNQGRRDDWESGNELLSATVVSGIDQSTEFLALRFAQVQQQGQQGQLLVQVNEVKNLGEFNKVWSYLDSLTTVSQVQAFQVSSDRVIFKLSTRSGRVAVEQAIALGATLVADAVSPVATPPATGTSQPAVATVTADLAYRLIQ